MTANEPITIVGAGHAGLQLAASLRQLGSDDPIVLVNNEPHLPYQRPPLSKAFLQGTADPETVSFRSQSFFRDQRINLVDDEVIAIDRFARKAIFQSGHSLTYRHLVIATGARNRVLQMPNADHDDVHYLRTLADSETIRGRLAKVKRVIVIGAGFIGLEFASTAAQMGIDVDIIELAPRIMARVVSPTVSAYFQKRHEAAGCRVHCGRAVAAIETANGRLQGVLLDDGRMLAADLIVVGIGVVPNVELALEAGLPSEEGIAVDEHLATLDPNISAIGDCARFSSPRYPSAVRLESVANATDQAKCLAARLTGLPKPFESVAWFWSDQGSDKLQIAGFFERHDEAVVRGDPDQNSFSVFFYGQGKLLGVESVNRSGDHMAARRLLAAGVTVCPSHAANPSFELKNAL
ncbi:pyridine nucleotide-disulfide oxidoreductase [Mesorhizobium sp. B3-2-1]|uniref:NAD(P)/FAD-dependent oxidoreductase n=1 Tax=Mesorhizobium sp. B3-2-1 TaxID=2589891 RepID=UPI001127026C|nr:FAD-dependent oxidoreductase [Mesorhizobium sp. B3-2-1]TPI27614.1 pyridine nucleotide-disulfide oxidoreductase [Mesorhizobium sp. B3-2-1]